MDERSLVLLRRKLEALNYTERLDAASGPLVSRLVEDLCRATDAHRACRQQISGYAQEIATFNTKVGPLSRAHARAHTLTTTWRGPAFALPVARAPRPTAVQVPNPPMHEP